MEPKITATSKNYYNNKLSIVVTVVMVLMFLLFQKFDDGVKAVADNVDDTSMSVIAGIVFVILLFSQLIYKKFFEKTVEITLDNRQISIIFFDKKTAQPNDHIMLPKETIKQLKFGFKTLYNRNSFDTLKLGLEIITDNEKYLFDLSQENLRVLYDLAKHNDYNIVGREPASLKTFQKLQQNELSFIIKLGIVGFILVIMFTVLLVYLFRDYIFV